MKVFVPFTAALAIVAIGLFPGPAFADCRTNVAALQQQLAETESKIRSLLEQADRQFGPERDEYLRRIRELFAAGGSTKHLWEDELVALRNLAPVIEKEYVAIAAALMTGVVALRQVESFERNKLEYAVVLFGSFDVPLPNGGEVIFRRDHSVHNFRFWSATVCPALLDGVQDGQPAWKKLVGLVDLKEGLTTRQVEVLRNMSPEDRQAVLRHIDGRLRSLAESNHE